jgi:hypothetical protein
MLEGAEANKKWREEEIGVVLALAVRAERRPH